MVTSSRRMYASVGASSRTRIGSLADAGRGLRHARCGVPETHSERLACAGLEGRSLMLDDVDVLRRAVAAYRAAATAAGVPWPDHAGWNNELPLDVLCRLLDV